MNAPPAKIPAGAHVSMCTLLPMKCTESKFTSLSSSFEIYGTFLAEGPAALEAEFGRWQRKWARVPIEDRPATLIDALSSCSKSLYLNFAILLQIFATITVTTATAESIVFVFSSLRLLKTYLRSTMKEDHLDGVALMAIHKDVRFKYDDVITEFAKQHDHCFKFE